MQTPRLLIISTLLCATPSPQILAEEPPDTPTYEIVVVGAGIAGLTAAYFLQDCHLKVLEKNDYVGGRTVSGTYQGFTYAKGTEYLGPPEGTLATLIQALKLQPKEIPAPMDAHFYNNQFYYGEDGIALMYIEQSLLADYNRFVKMIQSDDQDYEDVPHFDFTSPLADLDNLTTRQWFDKQKFPAIVYDTYNVAARGLFGANLDEISALSAIPEIAFDYENAGSIENIDALDNSPTPTNKKTGAYTFLTGITEVTTAMAHPLKEKIQLNATVTNISQQKDRYLLTYTDNQGNTLSVAAKVVILAVPAPVTLKLAPTLLSQEQKTIMQQIPYASYVTVALFSQERIWDQSFDLAMPDGYFFTNVYDSTWIQRHYDNSLKDQPDGIMTIYIPPKSYQDQSLLKMTDEEILRNVYTDLEKVLPGAQDKIIGYDLQRFPYAYPVMTLGAYKRLTRLHEITQGGLLLAGDYLIYPTFEAAVESGYLAAAKAVSFLNNQCHLKTSFNWGKGVDANLQPVKTLADFTPSVTTTSGLSGNHLTIAQTEEVTVATTITVDPAHVGQRAELLAVASFLPLVNPQPLTLMRDTDTWKSWDGNIKSLTVMEVKSQLGNSETLTVYQGNLQGLAGNFLIRVGYRLQDGTIIYSGEPIEFTVN